MQGVLPTMVRFFLLFLLYFFFFSFLFPFLLYFFFFSISSSFLFLLLLLYLLFLPFPAIRTHHSHLPSHQIILAIYYTFADILLLGQCFYYRGFHFRDPKPLKPSDTDNGTPNENSALLPANGNGNAEMPRTRSGSSFGERFVTEGVHMSPANPMHPVPKVQRPRTSKRSLLQKVLFNMTVITLVVAAGIAGYYLSPSSSSSSSNKTEQEHQNDNLHFNLTGQIFGYLCALLYLGSRIPQLLLNYRRKSTEGLNALFFLFACIGNLTYVLSIFAFNPLCHHRHHGKNKCRPGEAQQIYGRYILVNLSWILGSLGTLFLDFGVFAQFFIYRSVDDEVEEQQQQQQEEEQAVQDVFEDRGRSVQ
jgi:uncharacterized protein with PQ loop repeat